MINVFSILDIAESFFEDEGFKQVFKDGRVLYGVYTAIVNAGKFSPSVMVKDSTLWPVIEAVNRATDAMLKMRADPVKKQEIETELSKV